MLTGSTGTIDIWRDSPDSGPFPYGNLALLEELRSLATSGRNAAELSAVLYELLRKHTRQPLAAELLRGIQFLAWSGEPAGARLLGAMLEVAAPAHRLLPLVRNMSSSRRLWLGRLKHDDSPGLVMAEWQAQCRRLAASCRAALEGKELQSAIPTHRIGWEEPWGFMRTMVSAVVDHVMDGGSLGGESRGMLVDLLRLETDAWEERISSLAGNIDPFRVAAITRLLPILSKADADIRDLRHLIQLIQDRCDEEAFLRPRLRALEVLEERDLTALNQTLDRDEGLAPLAALYRAQQKNPLPVAIMAHGVARLQALVSVLKAGDIRTTDLDLLSACRLVASSHGQGEVAFAVPGELTAAVETLLAQARGPRSGGRGPDSWSLDGVEVLVGQLVVVLPEAGGTPALWDSFLPTRLDFDPLENTPVTLPAKPAAATEREAEEDPDVHLNASAMKNLVLTNIQSTSVTLGFLRNPKFISIPGLVEAIAVRTRNPRVIETIAVDRSLHAGFANRGVPLACLRSPVNVSVKILRKFIHVKFISKADLKRLALDRAGVRKEIIREIEKYLEALA